MAAISAVPTAASGLTPPSSSHGSGNSNVNGNGYAWNGSYSATENDETLMHHKMTAHHYDATNGHARPPMMPQNGHSPTESVVPTPRESDSNLSGMAAAAYLSPPHGSSAAKPPSVRDSTAGSLDSLTDVHASSNRGTKRLMGEANSAGASGALPDDSKWIHRDKLARIENEELQAAGIFLPAPRSHSRPRHSTQERPSASRKTSDADLNASRSRKNSSAVAGSTLGTSSGDARSFQATTPDWDLRLPEEIEEAEEANYWTSVNGMKGSSRIPVAKASPAPIPPDVLERDTPARRRRDSSPNDEGADIKMPRTRTRSSSASTKLEVAANAAVGSTPQPKRAAADSSPKKGPGSRKGSGKSSSIRAKKTRGAASKDSTSSASGTTRPSTRSGERELATAASPGSSTRAPEGDPPWMVSAYKPDPRLPPDQQLLPTVAKRLQQEKWEREGKFGSIYDKEFRPLTDDGFLSPPEPKDKASPQPEEKQEEKTEDWPLKAEPKSPTAPSLRVQRAGSYSTIPKVQDPPLSPLPPPSRGNGAPGQPSPLIRVPDIPDEDTGKEKKGCMCCVVM